jgi:hypothetical protein
MFGLISLKKDGNGREMPNSAIIGEDTGHDSVSWKEVDFDYAISLYEQGILEYRGYEAINDICVHKFYLPPPLHTYESE